jgi:hypothetical protein
MGREWQAMMYRAFFFLTGIIALCLPAGCGPKAETAIPASPSTDALAEAKADEASYDPDKGLYLPETTRQGMGIATVPVQKKTFKAERMMKFQVFREAGEEPLPGMLYRSGRAYASTILAGPKLDLVLGQTGEVLEEHDSQTVSAARLFQLNTLPNSNQTELLIEITDPQDQFALAEFCTVQWRMPALEALAAVPVSALLKTTEGDFVYVQKADRFVRTEVKPGATGEGFAEITEGVADGDIVVTNPVQTLWLTELKLKSGGSEP